ncbi:hypothetical protein B0I35DRAFT_477723 [Stachybotrys elegans]|uniref:VWFA domain-containing protein n=1 Tax=Stachybotrys elegans TaxID=80388 RepID=A0A8K0WTI6_9HYPO|nr:hypothetical protein B0I35DRAFT_477723 [Stachybotrys elegans]
MPNFLDSIKNNLSRKTSSGSKKASMYEAESSKGAPPSDTLTADAPPPYSAAQPTNPFSSLAPGNVRSGHSPAPSLASVSTPEDKYAFLSSFDTIFLIDDSSSMYGSRWKEVGAVLEAITPICTDHDSDGIDVYFLNHRSRASNPSGTAQGGYYGVTSSKTVTDLFKKLGPSGGTPTGHRLDELLTPYLEKLERAHDPASVKPVNIIVITDGAASDDPESIIVRCAGKLDKLDALPYQVGIQFFQVGHDRSATEDLADLDDGLAKRGVRDMVDTVTWDSQSLVGQKSLTADAILKVVLGAVVRRLDRKKTTNTGRSMT